MIRSLKKFARVLRTNSCSFCGRPVPYCICE